MSTKVNQPRPDDIGAAVQIVLDLAIQGTTDRYDNPTRYRREMAAINLVRQTLTQSGEL